MSAVRGDIQGIALTSTNSYFQLGNPRIPLSMQCPRPRLGFCCKGKVSLTSPLPHLKEKKKKSPLTVARGGAVIKLCQSCFCKMSNLSGVNVRDREGTESGTSLQGSKRANMQCDTICTCFSGPQGLAASPAWESAV